MLVGRLTKDSAELRRVTVDYFTNGWLDTGETISAVSTPVVVVEITAGIVLDRGYEVISPAPPLVDVTPLVVQSIYIVSQGQFVQLMLGLGTPGITYKVTFLATGATSGRIKQVDLLVTIREPI